MATFWIKNIQFVENNCGINPASPFCGCTLIGENESRHEESSLSSSNTNNREESTDISSSIWKFFSDPNAYISDLPIVEETNDDETVISTTDTSVLSLDKGKTGPIVDEKQLNLSEVYDDDESTVGSFDSNSIPETLCVDDSDIKIEDIKKQVEQYQQVNQTRSRSRSKSTSSSKLFQFDDASFPINSRPIKNDPDAEKRRIELLLKLKALISTVGRYTLQVADMVRRIGEFHENVNQNEVALTLYHEALNIYGTKRGDHDASAIDMRVRIGDVYIKVGKDTEGLYYLCNALFMVDAIYGAYDVKGSDISVKIAKIHDKHGRIKDAIKELKKALRGYREKYGDEHTMVAETVDAIADVYTHGGNYDKAKTVRSELVKLRVAIHGNKCLEVAEALAKWAESNEDTGDLNGALKVMKQSYIMYHDLEGESGIHTMKVLEKIGSIYQKLGRDDKALKAFTSVVVMSKERYGDNSTQTAQGYFVLGGVFSRLKQYEKALKAYNRSLSIYGASTDQSKETADKMMDVLHEIGMTYFTSGKHQQALKAYVREHSIRQKISTGTDTMKLARTHLAMGKVHCEISQYEAASAHLLEALKLYDKQGGRNILFAESLSWYADSLLGLGSNDKAKQAYKETMQILKANGIESEQILNNHKASERLSKLSKGFDFQKVQPGLHCTILDGDRANSGRVEV